MSQAHTQIILDQLRALIPNATSVTKVSSSRAKRDTLTDARSKTAAKLRENAAVFLGSASRGSVDSVCKKQSNGQYAVGIKYGNRYLQDAIGGGTYVANVSEDKVAQVLELLACQVDQGMYDDAVQKVMDDNVAARNKDVH